MTQSYYAKELAEVGITIESAGLDTPHTARVDAEQISRVVMSMIGNSIYAVTKKYRLKPYSPIIRLTISP